jgi:hypothetical protein
VTPFKAGAEVKLNAAPEGRPPEEEPEPEEEPDDPEEEPEELEPEELEELVSEELVDPEEVEATCAGIADEELPPLPPQPASSVTHSATVQWRTMVASVRSSNISGTPWVRNSTKGGS